MEKEASNSLVSKIYESFLRQFLNDRISSLIEDKNAMRKYKDFEWDAVYRPHKRFRIEEILSILDGEFEKKTRF